MSFFLSWFLFFPSVIFILCRHELLINLTVRAPCGKLTGWKCLC